MTTQEKIKKIIGENGQISANELSEKLEISRQALYRHLPKMLADKQIIKIGRSPKVYYAIGAGIQEVIKYEIDDGIKKQIDENFFIITPAGVRMEGFAGFIYWCEKQELPILKTANEYINTLKKYSIFRKDGLINGMQKINGTFDNVFLDNIYYLDFYSIERFGKTKLGQMLLYAKQSQNKKLMKELIEDIRPRVEELITKYQVDGVGFVPPTVKREVQFMSELKKKLGLNTRNVAITKIKTDIIIPQKTLNKLSDRIENAQRTFIVEGTGQYNNILLIDDAVGSGATLNEIAKKIKDKGLAKKVIGLAITGSAKGFDVISEV